MPLPDSACSVAHPLLPRRELGGWLCGDSGRLCHRNHRVCHRLTHCWLQVSAGQGCYCEAARQSSSSKVCLQWHAHPRAALPCPQQVLAPRRLTPHPHLACGRGCMGTPQGKHCGVWQAGQPVCPCAACQSCPASAPQSVTVLPASAQQVQVPASARELQEVEGAMSVVPGQLKLPRWGKHCAETGGAPTAGSCGTQRTPRCVQELALVCVHHCPFQNLPLVCVLCCAGPRASSSWRGQPSAPSQLVRPRSAW